MKSQSSFEFHFISFQKSGKIFASYASDTGLMFIIYEKFKMQGNQ